VIDHVSVGVTDYDRSKAFYAEALRPLGYSLLMEFGGNVAGLGAEGKPDFWLIAGTTSGATHIAFRSPDRSTVDAFHAAAVAAGGEDNGSPGLRPHYHESYYGAYVRDPDGNNVEAVCHKPE
jgi:catechol 2,3-dioxygenase-like lactoylglutathione lyase family enzyme